MTNFIKRPVVERMTGLSCTELYRRIAAGTFPQQVQLGPKSVAWVEEEIAAWQQAQIAAGRKENN
nr:AlpA family phage regulatory protein [uncultured Pseudomonas sp.]